MRNTIKSIFVLAGVALATGTAHAQVALTCREQVLRSIRVLTPDEFPQLNVWEKKDDQSWSVWAADEANRVVDQLAAGQSPRDILESLRLARASGKFSHNEPDGKISWRFDDPDRFETRLGYFTHVPDLDQSGYYNDTTFNPKSNELAKLAWNETPKVLRYSDRVVFQFWHRALSGAKVPSTKIEFYNPGRVLLTHPSGPESKIIYEDFLARLDEFLADVTKDKAKFARLASAYFNAMPLYRGSASMGRVFLGALYNFSFGEKRTLNPAIDLYAMFLTENRFVDFFLEEKI